MIFKTKPNYFLVFPKFIPLGFLLSLNLLIYSKIISSIFRDDINEGEITFLCMNFIFSLAIVFLGWLILRSIRIFVLTTSGMEINFPFRTQKIIYAYNQIKEFYTSHGYNKQKSFAQIIIYFNKKGKLKISKEWVGNYTEMVDAFKQSPIKYSGYKEQGLIDFED